MPNIQVPDYVAKFFAVSGDFTFWDFLNSPFFVAVIATLVGWWINRGVEGAKRVAQDADKKASNAFEQAVDAVEKADDATLVVTSRADEQDEFDDEAEDIPDDGTDMRSQTSEIVDSVKARIDQYIKDDADLRHQRTYKRLPKYDYTVLAAAL